jgi:hypothetical protein
MVGLLQAPSGTKLYERLKQEGRLLGHMSGNTDGTTNIVTRMDLQSLREGYKRIMAHIYTPKHYYRRVKMFLQECQPPKIKIQFESQRFLALYRSVVHLGILGKERFQYWRLMCWTLFHRPRMLTIAVTLAIYGHHFRKISEIHIR